MFSHHHHHDRHRETRSRGEFGFHGRMRGLRHVRRGERVFDQGDLRYVILKLISEAPRHGYEIIKAIEEKVGGAYSPSPGVIYPTLTLLEELGFVTVQSAEGGKRLYSITDAGAAELADKKNAVDAIFNRMAEVNERFEGPSPRIARAMQNLGMAIATRMRAGRVDAEQLDALVNAIDEAARKVEKA